MLKALRFRRFLGMAAVILGIAALAIASDPPPPLGACSAEDGAWTTAGGGCTDLATGLVWGSEGGIRDGSLRNYDYAAKECSNLVENGYSDWRLATIDEILTATTNGAYTHLSTHLNHEGVPTMASATFASESQGKWCYTVSFANRTVSKVEKKRTFGSWRCVRP